MEMKQDRPLPACVLNALQLCILLLKILMATAVISVFLTKTPISNAWKNCNVTNVCIKNCLQKIFLATYGHYKPLCVR
jgi:hypothetical protein